MARARSTSGRTQQRDGSLVYLQAAAEACPHGLMVTQAGRILYANAGYARLAGVACVEKMLGASIRDFAELKSPGANGAIYETTGIDFEHGGEKLTLHIRRDVRERRALEARLRESEKMEALGRLVGGVAHDFNNILTAITLYSDLLHDRTQRTTREVEEIREAAQRGADLVRQLLTFARQHPTAPKVISVRQIITSMSSVIEPLIGEDIELAASLSAAADCVSADPSQLQQVILNLVINARDAMPNGGRISIETSRCEFSTREAARHPGSSPGAQICIKVTDNGCGMSEEVRTRIFEPFFTTKTHGTGTGLGMAMVYSIVRQAGGTVTVSSKAGKGTCVTVLLPAVAGNSKSASAGERGLPMRGSETILLVEDDTAVRCSIAELLHASGYHVLQARDGWHAVRVATTHPEHIALLLTDVVMPRLNGVQASEKIRALHPETKVLLMSGYPAKAHLSAAAQGLLYKPFSRAVLAAKVREILEQPSTASKTMRTHARAGRAIPAHA